MRSKRAKKRKLNKDPLYQSVLVQQLINQLMQQGKKGVAARIVYKALKNLGEEKEIALRKLEQAVRNATPREEVRSRRVGGATYQVPLPVRPDRAQALAIRWLLVAATKRSGRPMVERLTLELEAAAVGEGAAVSKKDTSHRMAESNRAFAHFRW